MTEETVTVDDVVEHTSGQQIAIAPREKAALVAESREVMAFLPRTIEEAQRYASGLIAANQVPDAFREGGKKDNPPNAALVLMGILKCSELEVAPQTGLAGILPLNGRFNVWGDLAAALVQRSGKVSDQTAIRIGPAFDPDAPLGEWPADHGWEVRYWREGQANPYIGRFTVREAKRAGLWMCAYRKPWIMYPDRMLFNRARAFALRDGFADALCGLSIAEEVLDSLPPEGPEGASESRNLDALDDEVVTDDEARAADAEIHG